MNNDKYHILRLVQEHNLSGIFAEIGTWTGDFAEALLTSTKCSTLLCIDPYKYFQDESYQDAMNKKFQDTAEQRFQDAKARLENAARPPRLQMIRKLSVEAARDVSDASLDFVYIDANHEYSYALQDILTWYPKVKPGGILAGDDIWSTILQDYKDNNLRIQFGTDTWGVFGVYPAVLEAQKQLDIHFTIIGTQFYCIKPPAHQSNLQSI